MSMQSIVRLSRLAVLYGALSGWLAISLVPGSPLWAKLAAAAAGALILALVFGGACACAAATDTLTDQDLRDWHRQQAQGSQRRAEPEALGHLAPPRQTLASFTTAMEDSRAASAGTWYLPTGNPPARRD